MDLITPGFGLVFWTAITFLILLFILKKFAWKPILGAVSTREQSIKDALAAAEQARLEMENLHADNERILQEARAERENMIKEAREIKNKMIADAKDEAQATASKMIQQAQVTIESEKKAAVSELKEQVAALSIDIAQKVIKQELSENDQQAKLVDDLLGKATLN
ncbi:MAG TPA: F0F1 ATP synthase subunit B [Flavobacteriaceae bacterium]|nr:F0F1 ATP synthase subunit B [Flavobacteriaceae bacterium]